MWCGAGSRRLADQVVIVSMMFSPRAASSLSSNGISWIDPDPGRGVTKPTLTANETILPIRRNNPETHWAYLIANRRRQSR